MENWQKRQIRRAMRQYPLHGVDYLAEKQRLKDRIAECTEDGMVAVIRDGMDCDCTQYLRVTHIPAPTLVAWNKAEEDHYEWLDGPESTHFGKPSEYPERHRSSDRALEAYENGSMHLVTRTDLWTD